MADFTPEYSCYKCGIKAGKGVTLLSVKAPGIYFMCTECIEKHEKETGLVGVFHGIGGLFFTDKETAERLINDSDE